MTPLDIYLGMWAKVLTIFFPAVVFGIVGLAYIYIDERKVR